MKISKELSTGTIPTMVLSVIKSEDMYGYKIIKTLEQRSDNVFSLKEGTLYPILHSMEKEDLLESYWETADGRYYEADYCYIDENGYLLYDKNGSIKSDKNGVYKNSSGRVYTKAVKTSWDKDGSILTQKDEYQSNPFSLFTP